MYLVIIQIKKLKTSTAQSFVRCYHVFVTLVFSCSRVCVLRLQYNSPHPLFCFHSAIRPVKAPEVSKHRSREGKNKGQEWKVGTGKRKQRELPTRLQGCTASADNKGQRCWSGAVRTTKIRTLYMPTITGC